MSAKSERKRQIKDGSRRLLGGLSASDAHSQGTCLEHCHYCREARRGEHLIRHFTPEAYGKICKQVTMEEKLEMAKTVAGGGSREGRIMVVGMVPVMAALGDLTEQPKP